MTNDFQPENTTDDRIVKEKIEQQIEFLFILRRNIYDLKSIANVLISTFENNTLKTEIFDQYLFAKLEQLIIQVEKQIEFLYRQKKNY